MRTWGLAGRGIPDAVLGQALVDAMPSGRTASAWAGPLRSGWLAIFAVAGLVGTACAGDSSSPGSENIVRSDSAGVQIVTSRAPVWGPDEGWHVVPDPEVSLGGMDSAEGHVIWEVRGGARLSDGRIALLSGGQTAPRLSIFDRAGGLVRQIGRSGRGPGEFVEPQHLQYLTGDTLVVWERHFGRITSFDTAGTVIGTRHLDLERLFVPLRFGGSSRLLLPLVDGSLIAQASPPSPAPDEIPLGQLYRSPLTYVRVREDYSADTLGWYGSIEAAHPTFPGMPVFPLFPAMSSVAASRDPLMLFVSNGDGSGIRVFDSNGRLVRIIRRDVPPHLISPEERARALVRMVGEEGNEWYEERLQKYAHQTHRPDMTVIFVDLESHVWAYERARSSGWVDWNVFEPAGTWLGRVRVPPMDVLEIGSDYILGVQRDALGVASVHEYRLDRRGSGARP